MTDVIKGKRQWNANGTATLLDLINQEECEKKYLRISKFLEECLTNVGFVVNFKELKTIGKTIISYSLSTNDWEVSLGLFFDHKTKETILRINQSIRPLRDLFPLWGLLRKDYVSNKKEQDLCVQR